MAYLVLVKKSLLSLRRLTVSIALFFASIALLSGARFASIALHRRGSQACFGFYRAPVEKLFRHFGVPPTKLLAAVRTERCRLRASYSPPALAPTQRGSINQGVPFSARRRAFTSRSAAHIACTGRRTEADTAARLLCTTTPQPVMRTSDEHFNPTPATVVGDTPSMAARANIV